MAREVNTVLAQIIAESRGVSEQKGEEIVKNMRAANQYQVRTTMSPNPNPPFLDEYLLTLFFCRRMSGLRFGNDYIKMDMEFRNTGLMPS